MYVKGINLGRIIFCEPYEGEYTPRKNTREITNLRNVELEVIDERKALERALLHFAHFKKQAERIEGDKYKVTVTYDGDDETEILIRILSFGPMVKVTGPDHFLNLIKDRLKKQKSCGH